MLCGYKDPVWIQGSLSRPGHQQYPWAQLCSRAHLSTAIWQCAFVWLAGWRTCLLKPCISRPIQVVDLLKSARNYTVTLMRSIFFGKASLSVSLTTQLQCEVRGVNPCSSLLCHVCLSEFAIFLLNTFKACTEISNWSGYRWKTAI